MTLVLGVFVAGKTNRPESKGITDRAQESKRNLNGTGGHPILLEKLVGAFPCDSGRKNPLAVRLGGGGLPDLMGLNALLYRTRIILTSNAST